MNIKKLKKILQEYDKILFITYRTESFLQSISKENKQNKKINIKILLIIPEHLETPVFESDIYYEIISEKDAQDLAYLYHTYEFSDHFVMPEENQPVASVFNLVRSGLLTLEEAWQALLT